MRTFKPESPPAPFPIRKTTELFGEAIKAYVDKEYPSQGWDVETNLNNDFVDLHLEGSHGYHVHIPTRVVYDPELEEIKRAIDFYVKNSLRKIITAIEAIL